VKLTPDEDKVVRKAISWYVTELTSLVRGGFRNTAFESATTKAITNLNEVLQQRLALAFSDVLVRDPKRYAAITSYAIRLANNAIETLTDTPPRHQKGPGDDTLASYLHTLEALLQATRNTSSVRTLDGRSSDEGQRLARSLWASMRNARIFDFSHADYALAHHSADVYTTTKIAGLSWVPEGQSTLTTDESETYIERIHSAGERVPFPDPLPFDSFFIGFGYGVPLTELQAEVRTAGALHQRKLVASALLGYIVSHSDGGWITEIIQVVESDDNYILPNVVCARGVWQDPIRNLAPWITTHLIGVINDHRQLILESKPSFAQKRSWQKKGKALKVHGLIPKPYYVVRLEKALIEDTGRRTRGHLAKIARELSYRHDRRGHERCYIRRGKLPISADDLEKLQRAEYRIWTLDEPDSNAYRQLMERGQPPKAPNEWIAILTRWIDPTVVGPEDAPYVPAIRIPSAGRATAAPRSAMPGVPREA